VGAERIVRPIQHPIQNIIESILVSSGDEAVDLPARISVAQDSCLLSFIVLRVHQQVGHEFTKTFFGIPSEGGSATGRQVLLHPGVGVLVSTGGSEPTRQESAQEADLMLEAVVVRARASVAPDVGTMIIVAGEFK